jgi:hypothetical protein
MVLGAMEGGTGAFRGEVYASSEVDWGKGVGIEMLMYEEDEEERLRDASADENGMLNDIVLFLSIFDEMEMDGSLYGKSFFKFSLPSEGTEECPSLW